MPNEHTADQKRHIILSALKASEFQGWDGLTLNDIAAEAKLSLADLRSHYDDKMDILYGLGRLIDEDTLRRLGKFSPEQSVRETLFEILMERFDVLNEHREGILAILNGFRGDPKQALFSVPALARSMSWMLEAAHINTCGIRGNAVLAAFTGLYLKVLYVWMRDDSEDMSSTMAALDKNLNRAEQIANTLGL